MAPFKMKYPIVLVIWIIAISVSSATSIAISGSFETRTTDTYVSSITDTLNIQAISEGFRLDVLMLKKSNHKEKLPAIVFIFGSGENSSMKTYKDFTEFFFENTLLENGFAIVYFDKRGVGKSEGIWYETTFEQRAVDAKNVALEIQKLDFINKDEIFVVGHSQGGWIVQIALAQYPEIFAGGISMAGPTFGVKRQLVNDYQSGIICNKGFDEEKAFKKANRKVNRDLFFISLVGKKGNLKQLNIIKDFEAEPYIKAIDKPFLMLFAENDPLVSPKWSIDALKDIFPDSLPASMEYYVAPGENHSFKVAPECYRGKWADIFYSETSRQKIFDWLNAQSIRHGNPQ